MLLVHLLNVRCAWHDRLCWLLLLAFYHVYQLGKLHHIMCIDKAFVHVLLFRGEAISTYFSGYKPWVRWASAGDEQQAGRAGWILWCSLTGLNWLAKSRSERHSVKASRKDLFFPRRDGALQLSVTFSVVFSILPQVDLYRCHR